jgi:hypothetical protein
VASTTVPVRLFGRATGGNHRNSPTGGWANGTPRNWRTPGVVPLMIPCTRMSVSYVMEKWFDLEGSGSHSPLLVLTFKCSSDHVGAADTNWIDTRSPKTAVKLAVTMMLANEYKMR